MADKTGIAWTDATTMVDRGGGRVRLYRRQNPARPGQQERRLKLKNGLRWCRGCQDWLPADSVRQGACRACLSAEERRRYALCDEFREYRKGQRDLRRRNVARVNSDHGAMLLEMFEGECAYCHNQATTWDHARAVSLGGKTTSGNIVPACSSCNSRKRADDIDRWIDHRAPIVKEFTIEFLAAMGTL